MKITLEKDLPNAYTSFGFDGIFPGKMIERVEYELSDEDILAIGDRYKELIESQWEEQMNNIKRKMKGEEE